MYKYIIPKENRRLAKRRIKEHGDWALLQMKDFDPHSVTAAYHVFCKLHPDCPIKDGNPPTVETCWQHASLPARYIPGMHATDQKRMELVEMYYRFACVPGYEPEVENSK